MKFIDSFRYWVAKPLLDGLLVEFRAGAVDLQREAYRLGVAHGGVAGRAGLIMELMQAARGRGPNSAGWLEITQEDLERARRGMTH